MLVVFIGKDTTTRKPHLLVESGDKKRGWIMTLVVCEAVLAIMAMNIYEYIPLLAAIERKSQGAGLDYDDEVHKYIERFHVPEKDTERINEFVKSLRETGQSIHDWNFNMRSHVYRDYDEEIERNPYAVIQRYFDMIHRQKQHIDNYLSMDSND